MKIKCHGGKEHQYVKTDKSRNVYTSGDTKTTEPSQFTVQYLWVCSVCNGKWWLEE